MGAVELVAEAGGTAGAAVAVNDARLLPSRAGLPVVWFHNEVTLAREWRRGRLPALRRHRPVAVFVGRSQAASASRLLPFRARATIPLGLRADLAGGVSPPSPPAPPLALFTSQAYRGLDEVLGLWTRHIAPVLPEARLEARIAAQDVAAYPPPGSNITIGSRLPNAEVSALLRRARVWLAPGHRSETFCLAAAEAIACGIPVVTRGRGALRERVRHGATGFLARSARDMAAHTIALLSDDALWARMHVACLAEPQPGWPEIARRWLALAGGQVA